MELCELTSTEVRSTDDDGHGSTVRLALASSHLPVASSRRRFVAIALASLSTVELDQVDQSSPVLRGPFDAQFGCPARTGPSMSRVQTERGNRGSPMRHANDPRCALRATTGHQDCTLADASAVPANDTAGMRSPKDRSAKRVAQALLVDGIGRAPRCPRRRFIVVAWPTIEDRSGRECTSAA
jgi:hypothetical protein